jgi:hypothetical protein
MGRDRRIRAGGSNPTPSWEVSETGGGLSLGALRVSEWEDRDGDRHRVLTLPGLGETETGAQTDAVLVFRNGLLESVQGGVSESSDDMRVQLHRERAALQKAQQELQRLKAEQEAVRARSAGVSAAPERRESDMGALAALWDSTPDVSGMFGSTKQKGPAPRAPAPSPRARSEDESVLASLFATGEPEYERGSEPGTEIIGDVLDDD